MAQVLLWVCPSWHMGKDALHLAEGTSYRMARAAFRIFRPQDEPWLDWHGAHMAPSHGSTQAAWGCQPAALVAARAVSGVHRCVTRSACSPVGDILRWRSAANVEALRTMGGGLGHCSRHKMAAPSCGRNLDGYMSPALVGVIQPRCGTGKRLPMFSWPWLGSEASKHGPRLH